MSLEGDADYTAGLAQLQAICNVSEQRGMELLEASNGSLERAVDIFLHQQGQVRDAATESQQKLEKFSSPAIKSIKNESKKRASQSSQSTPTEKSAKQAQLSSYFKSNALSSPRQKRSATVAELVTSAESHVKAVEILTEVNARGGAIPNIKAQNGAKRQRPRQAADKIELNVSFGSLSKTLQSMADTTKRTTKLSALQNFIIGCIQNAEEAEKAYGLACALNITLGKAGENPLGVSGRTVSSALQIVLGASSKQLSRGYRESGDLGDAAASFFQEKRFFVSMNSSGLSVIQVHRLLQGVANAEGGNAKKDIVLKLLRTCQSKNEIRFMVRLLVGNMRIGCNIKTILAAVAMAFHSAHEGESTIVLKSAVRLVQKTHDLCPNLEKILMALLAGGFSQMKADCGIQLLTPIAPMLAHPMHSLEEVEKVMVEMSSSAVLEWKYDGVRCQAHFDGKSAKLFSRHMLETTDQYPDAVNAILGARKTSRGVKSFIVDSEIVGVERDGNQMRLLPFQDLSRRKKKDDGRGVQVKVFVFDIMYFNGQSCVDLPLWKRQRILREYFGETEDFSFVSSRTLPSYDGPALQDFLEESVRHGTEGLMVKILGKQVSKEVSTTSTIHEESEVGRSSYEAGTRSHCWLKVKKDYVKGYADTIDVVPIGAWHGTGRKAQKSFLSPVLLAVYDEEEDVYRSISRCMTFTDAMYSAMREFYFRGTPYPTDLESGDAADSSANVKDGSIELDEEALVSTEFIGGDQEDLVNCFPTRPSSAYVVTNELPRFWFKPLEVFEVSFADMTLSRQHTAAAGLVPDSEGRGVALRFARFKRRRPDKRPDQATTTAEIAAMFSNQSKQASSISI